MRHSYPHKYGSPSLREHQTKLKEYPQRHGQDSAAALDEVLTTALDWERQDYEEECKAFRGYQSLKAGRTWPASEFMAELRAKHGF